VVSDLPSYVIAQAAVGLGGLASLVAYTRFLTPASYGTYAIVFASISICDTLAFGWVYQALMRYLPEREHEAGDAGTSLTTFVVCMGVMGATTAAMWLGGRVYLAARGAGAIVPVIGAGLLALQSRGALEFVCALQRVFRYRARYAFYTSLYALGGVAASVLMLAVLGARPQNIFYGLAVVATAGALLEMPRLSRAIGARHQGWFDGGLARRAISYGMPLLVSSAAGLILSLSDRYMIQFMLGARAVGLYSVGYDISDKAMKLSFFAIAGACYPVAIRTFTAHGEIESARLISRVTRLCIVVMMPIAVALIAARHLIIVVMAGSAFADAAPVLPWIAAGVLCLSISQLISQIFLLRENTRLLMWMLVVAAVLNGGLNLILIPRLGIMGAAYSTLVAYVAYLAMGWIAAGASAPQIFDGPWLAKLAAGALVAYLLMWAPAFEVYPPIPTLLLKATLGSFGYVAVLAVTGKNEIADLYRFLVPDNG
jgi:O-antigen/teichoic acid export membrane protein